VQDGEQADRRSDMASVAGELDDSLGGGLHQQGVAVTLVGAQRVAEFLGHGHGDVVIARRQPLGCVSACKIGSDALLVQGES
jgi:hypothetical protein